MKHLRNIKQIFTKNKFSHRVFMVLATILATITLASANAGAWGPSRPTYTNESPADYATFNSITNNAAVGDERNFVRIREAGTEDTFADEIEIIPGHEYEVYIYYHNNAATDTNASGFGVATNTRVASAYPTVVNSNDRGMVSGIITWSYVTPENPNDPQEGKVWDEAYVTTKTDGVALKYKTGTAIIHNSGSTNGSVLPSDLFTNEGTPIGFNKLTGTLPGCAEYSGHITYTLVAEKPGSELSKQVSVDGENWFDKVTVKPGDYVTYKVIFKNTGNTNFTNLILTDTHPEEIKLKSGSTTVYNYDHPDGYAIDDIIDISGHNTGDIFAGGITQVIYQMQVINDSSSCGKIYSNTIAANFNTTENKFDSAEVSVVCEETPPPAPMEDCYTNPSLPGCSTPNRLPETGPLEIAMAVIVVLGICAGGFYFYRTRRTLKTVSDVVSGGGLDGGNTPDSSVGGPDNSPISPDNSPITPDNSPTDSGTNPASPTDSEGDGPVNPVEATVNPTPASSGTDNSNPVEAAPADQTPTDQTPAEQPHVDQQTPTDQTPADQPPEPKQPFEPQPPIPPQA